MGKTKVPPEEQNVRNAIALAAEALDGLEWPEPSKSEAIRRIRELNTLTTLRTALDTIEESIVAITDTSKSTFLNVFLATDGWVARIEDAEDATDPFYGYGPSPSSEAAIVGLAQHIEAHT